VDYVHTIAKFIQYGQLLQRLSPLLSDNSRSCRCFVFTLFTLSYEFLVVFAIKETFLALEHLTTWRMWLTWMIMPPTSFALALALGFFAVRSLQSVSDNDNSFIIAINTTRQLSGYSMVVGTIDKW
jgi:hypothetical protein